jgi:hypothetical protein
MQTTLQSRGLRNSEIRFGIGIKKTKLSHTKLPLGFLKLGILKKICFPTFSEFKH